MHWGIRRGRDDFLCLSFAYWNFMINSSQYLLSTLRKKELEILILNGSREFYRKNAVIINEGDYSDSAYIIHSGKVRIFLSDDQGREIVLSELTAGEHFGEMALIDKKARSATVQAVADTELTVLSQKSFRKCMLSNPEITERIMFGLITNLREANKKISSLVFMDAYGRVADMLLALASDQDGLLVIDKKPTQQYIADVVGVSREMISRILRDMADDGYVSISGKRMVINRSGPFARRELIQK